MKCAGKSLMATENPIASLPHYEFMEALQITLEPVENWGSCTSKGITLPFPTLTLIRRCKTYLNDCSWKTSV
jgi:hypothetical protein